MKILYIAVGLTHYFNRVLSRLNDGNDIEIVAVVTAGKNLGIGDAVYETMDGINFRVCRLKESHLTPLYASYAGLGRLIAKERPDIVVVPDNMTLAFLLNPALLFLKTALGFKVVQQAIPFNVYAYPQALERLKQPTAIFESFPAWLVRFISATGTAHELRRFYLRLKALSYRWVDGHLNYIEDARAIYGSYGVPQSRIFVTYNSPDTDYYEQVEPEVLAAPPKLEPNPYRLIHVGRLVPWKRVDLLINAIGALKARLPKVELLVIGSGPQEAKLREQAHMLKLDDSVRFVGAVHDIKELGTYFRESTAYVLAGMGGLSINDAMFFGKPVVCSVCDGTERILVREGVNGLFFNEGDVSDLVAKLFELLSSPDDVRRMGEASRGIIDDKVNIRTVTARYRGAFDSVHRPN